MSVHDKLQGLYVITDDALTPDDLIFTQVESALKGGASIVQLRDKKSSDAVIKEKAKKLQDLCHNYDALFVLNDKIDLAIELECDGLHIGKSDHERFDEIRNAYKGILGVSSYSDIDKAITFQNRGADYVAFGSFFHSPTKPGSNIISLDILKEAKNRLTIPVCAIGGINTGNVDQVLAYKPQMISLIHDIWSAQNIEEQSQFYVNQLQGA